MKVSKYWKIAEFQKISIKMKNCKTFYETQTASCLKEIIQSPQPLIPLDKILSLWKKNFLERYTEIYRYLLSRKQFLGIRKWCSANVFSGTKLAFSGIFCYKFKNKKLMMSTGTCGNNIFGKKNYKYEILNNLYFGPSLVF